MSALDDKVLHHFLCNGGDDLPCSCGAVEAAAELAALRARAERADKVANVLGEAIETFRENWDAVPNKWVMALNAYRKGEQG